MNSLKPMLLMIVLGGILYGVYTVLNKGAAPESPAGAGRDWAKPPDLQLGAGDDGKNSPHPMPLSNPDIRIEPGAAAVVPPGQAALPKLVYPANNAAGDTAAGHPAPAAQIMPWNEPPRSDAASPAAGGSSPARDPAAAANRAAPSQETFAAAMESAKGLLGEGKLVEALRKMTQWYDYPQLSADESRQLGELLSQLAGTVVYSRQHLLQPPYKVKPGDRLETIAAQYNVPWQLLAKINGIDDPNRLNPGDELLKVVRGPFSALVELDKRQLTLIIDDCYAGRFNVIGVGDLARNLEGRSFEVGEKLPHGPVAGGEGSPIHHWVQLGNDAWIVGTSDPASLHPAGLNLNSRDAEDVYDILSAGSRVVVRR